MSAFGVRADIATCGGRVLFYTARANRGSNLINRRTIAWDFDGVLNRNIVDGEFIWQRAFETDLGLPLNSFVDFMFSGNFQKAMVGDEDLIALTRVWLSRFKTDISAKALLQERYCDEQRNP